MIRRPAFVLKTQSRGPQSSYIHHIE